MDRADEMSDVNKPNTRQTVKDKMDTIKRNLRASYHTLKVKCDQAERQVSIAKELKADIHMSRMRDLFSKCEATMSEIDDNISKLFSLGEEEESETVSTYRDWEKVFNKTAEAVKEA